MKNRTWLLVAALAVWAISSGPAWGSIDNGNFATNNLTGWDPNTTGDPLLALVDVVAYQLHMHVANNYVYEGSTWQLNPEETLSLASVTQNVAPNGGAPAGTTALRFEADVQFSNYPVGTTGGSVLVGVNYGGLNEKWVTYGSTEETQIITINLPGLVETGPVLDLYLNAFSGLDVQPDPADEPIYIVVDATFDNFEFIPGESGVVPEPLTIFSALLAVGGLGSYIRRRTASSATA